MSVPSVSIAMPFMNPGPLLQVCLKSIFCQTYTDWELILLDDGSTDGSAAVAEALCDPRVRYYRDGHNRRLNERLNQAIALAQGRYFVRMDADDVMHPNRIQRQIEYLEGRSHDTVLGTAAYSIDLNSKVVGIRDVPKRQAQGFAARMSFIHPTVAGYTTWFRKHLYPSSFTFHRSQDAELWARTSPVSCFEWLREPLLFYREQSGFSLANYLATEMGMIHIAAHLAAPKPYRMLKVAQESLKIAITASATILDKKDWIIRARYRRLPAAQREEAEALISKISQFELPAGAVAPSLEAV